MKIIKKIISFVKGLFDHNIEVNVENKSKYNIKGNKNIGSININEGVKNDKR